MGLLQASRNNTGGGSGLTIEGWITDQFEQTANFTGDGSLKLYLTRIPVSLGGILVDYNGQTKYQNLAWEYNSGTNSIVILFDDPYVTEYGPNFFQVIYPY